MEQAKQEIMDAKSEQEVLKILEKHQLSQGESRNLICEILFGEGDEPSAELRSILSAMI